MLIISARDNEKYRWKNGKVTKKKTEWNKGVKQAIVKVWELNDFVVLLKYVFYN